VADRTTQGKEGRSAKQWAAGIALALLLLFVLLNTQEVEVDFLVATATVPLIFALLLAGLLGALFGWLVPRVRRGGD
jgi:uncharacterized integral membrane protein